MGIRPCTYPKCGAPHGDPELTGEGMCRGCQRRFARLLSWVVLDWVHLSTMLPTPARRSQGRRMGQFAPGHPAEWASDMAAQITTILNWTHDSLADHMHASPPPHPGTAEVVRVRAAWDFLECRIPELAEFGGGSDAAIELRDLHGLVRSRLGLTRPRQILATPCPACDLRTLFRTIDVRRDSIDCASCGHSIREEHYPFLTRLVLDTILSTDQVLTESA